MKSTFYQNTITPRKMASILGLFPLFPNTLIKNVHT